MSTITLCGSARFEDQFHIWNKILTLSGHCVFGLGSYPSYNAGDKDWYSESEKQVLDAVHKTKIELSDSVLILNCFAYIGDSTLSELRYANEHGKKLIFLESWGEGLGIGHNHSKEYREKARPYFIDASGRANFPASPIDTFGHPSPWSLLPPAGEFRNKLIQIVNERGIL